MKKTMKNLLAGIGAAAIGLLGYALWENHTKEEDRARKEHEAKARADFIARRKAHMRAADAVKAEKAAEPAVEKYSFVEDKPEEPLYQDCSAETDEEKTEV